ncbi:GAF domain-containing protein [Gemmatimonas sp.]|uniref:GAF domain-containing protein n=1 Tax=Gemmatimonas sp. TaxID=1962908 RepID=UPI003F707061
MDDVTLMAPVPQFSAEGAQDAVDPRAITAALQNRERLREIAALRLTEPDVQHMLQDICGEASAAMGVPIGLVTIVLDEAQHFAAHHGLGGWLEEAGGTPSEWSFCRYTVATKAAFVVNDAQTNPLVQDSPLVSQDGLRCYAGMPLVSSRGHALGSLCVAGVEAKAFTDAELATLKRYAAEAMRRIETRRVELLP